jgi:hypothetical protein
MRAPSSPVWIAMILAVTLILAGCAGKPTATVSSAKQNITSLAFNPSDGSLLKADSTGLFRLTTDGQSWQPIQTPATSELTGVVINPDHPATVYVAAKSSGVLKSTDNGKSWSPINNGLTTTDVLALALHSFRRETLYAWLNGQGMYRTEDGGEHWSRLPDEGPPDSNVQGLVHSTLPGSMNTGWLYASTPSGAYLSMDCF